MPPRQFSDGGAQRARNYEWPGNLSQLQSVVQTLAHTVACEQIDLDDIERAVPQAATAPAAAHVLPLDPPLRDARDAFERIYFEHHIAREGGNISRVAESVGLERTHLYRKLKHLGIKLSRKHEE